jgi:hypothetical protein
MRKEYHVDSIDVLNDWLIKGDKNVLPNTPGQEVTVGELETYGNLSHVIDKVAAKGYPVIHSSDGDPLEITTCILYDELRMHDIFLRYVYVDGGNSIGIPFYVTYIPEVDTDLAHSDPVECIQKVRGIQLYSADNPQITEFGTRIIAPQTITIGDSIFEAVTIEYVDSDKAGMQGVIFFIYNDMIIQLQAPYSREGMPEVLSNIVLDTYYIPE